MNVELRSASQVYGEIHSDLVKGGFTDKRTRAISHYLYYRFLHSEQAILVHVLRHFLNRANGQTL